MEDDKKEWVRSRRVEDEEKEKGKGWVRSG